MKVVFNNQCIYLTTASGNVSFQLLFVFILFLEMFSKQTFGFCFLRRKSTAPNEITLSRRSRNRCRKSRACKQTTFFPWATELSRKLKHTILRRWSLREETPFRNDTHKREQRKPNSLFSTFM